MKITVINGNMRHGSTWNCMNTILYELSKKDQLEVTEFFLPKDMPHYCNGCFSCINNGEDTCPHSEYIKPIVDAFMASDVIILTSPVYGFDVSGQMKSLLDHLCFMWLSHRPNPKIFNKITVTVSTAAGMGLGHTTKTMKNSVVYWGVKKVFPFKAAVSAMTWSDVSDKKKAKIEKAAKKLAAKIYKSVNNIDNSPNPLFRSIFFKLMTGMQKKNTWNKTDRTHWESNGWLSGRKPF